MSYYLKNILGPILLLTTSATLASNLNFLKNSAIANMTEADVAILHDSIVQSLDELEDGKGAAWENPATGHSGNITILKSFTFRDHPCRTLKIDSQAGGQTGSGQFDYCKTPDGAWKILR